MSTDGMNLPGTPAPRVGLFDFEGYADLVETLRGVLALPAEEVHERLFREAVLTGWNVTRAAAAVPRFVPHVYTPEMEAFYAESDAFVFELAVIHQNRYCIEIDRRVGDAVVEAYPPGSGARILVLGDGIGTDSLRFALAGYATTYFEFEGYSSALALHRFARAGIRDEIEIIHDLDSIPEGHFDVVINREVLEHVPRPGEVVRNIWRYLKPHGLAVVTESFGRVEPDFPTHLAENARFAGQTPRLFVDAGFRVVRIPPDARPMVFRKTTTADSARYRTLPRQPSRFRRALRRVVRRGRAG
jgi:SAM-dependent methyltransferase